MNDILLKELKGKFHFDIDNISHQKSNDLYILYTSDNKKIMKKNNLSLPRIKFVHGAKEHLFDKGFCNLDRYICTVFGDPYIQINGNNYTITDWIEGKNCDFTVTSDTIDAAKSLALLHKTSSGYIPYLDAFPCSNLGLLPSLMEKRLSEIKKTKKIAQKYKSKFDHLVLRYIDYFHQAGEEALKLFPLSKYDQLVKKTAEERTFCHNNFSYSNILYRDSNLIITNFEFCSYELKIYDVTNLLRRKMRKCDWNVQEAKVILDHYRNIIEISKDELFIMKIMLQFPQKFWRIINKHYNSKRNWSEKFSVIKLQEVVDEIVHIQTFMDNFGTIY